MPVSHFHVNERNERLFSKELMVIILIYLCKSI